MRAVSDHEIPNEPLNPVQAESLIRETLNSISRSIRPVSEAYDEYRTAELAFKASYAKAYGAADGSIEDRKQTAVTETMEDADALRVAEVRYKYLLDHQRAYRDKLSAAQTLQKSVLEAYRGAGIGER